MLKIHKQFLAEEDLEDIWVYSFESYGERQADKYHDRLIKGIDLLAHNPALGISCDHIRKDYRHFQFNQHVVYYKVEESILTIVRVLHERMKPTKHFKNILKK